MKKLVLFSLIFMSAATVRSVKANKTEVGGVILPATDYLAIVSIALLVLWFAFIVFRKRSSILRHLGPMLPR